MAMPRIPSTCASSRSWATCARCATRWTIPFPTSRGPDMASTLIRGASVVTMDPQGDLPQGDILVEGDRIVAIAPWIATDDAEVVDARGCIVIPGLVNAHMHTRQTA